ncbi:acetamidase/formamidase family protein [Clostridium sp.]|uniref:acetamidase/formamidase family protein n=1 Tax=Clostridium sp. TaxID=1506 RepID=UPI001A4E5B85|nr:acetamidase/formamidase family protein [Clostridium sp.]MBK5236638.1 acetamidase/formamidase family protein [Clostridium sp.]
MYKVSSKNVVFSMDKDKPPVAEVETGIQISFETCDCFENQIQSQDTIINQLDWNRINPATGPVFVKGAMPGDTLVVKIENIKIGSQGVMLTGPNLGVLGDSLKENFVKILPIIDGKIEFSDKIKLPVNPMIGVIGTAPKTESISCGEPGVHGGNMDSKIIGIGSTIYLPVEVPGALLAMGDLHAVMGDGEVSVCGAEVPGEVTVTVEVIKGRPYCLPVVFTKEAVYTIASELSLDDAAVTATKNMVNMLVSKGMIEAEAISLLSLSGNVQISQIVDPLKTARFELPLWIYNSF